MLYKVTFYVEWQDGNAVLPDSVYGVAEADNPDFAKQKVEYHVELHYFDATEIQWLETEEYDEDPDRYLDYIGNGIWF